MKMQVRVFIARRRAAAAAPPLQLLLCVALLLLLTQQVSPDFLAQIVSVWGKKGGKFVCETTNVQIGSHT